MAGGLPSKALEPLACASRVGLVFMTSLDEGEKGAVAPGDRAKVN